MQQPDLSSLAQVLANGGDAPGAYLVRGFALSLLTLNHIAPKLAENHINVAVSGVSGIKTSGIFLHCEVRSLGARMVGHPVGEGLIVQMGRTAGHSLGPAQFSFPDREPDESVEIMFVGEKDLDDLATKLIDFFQQG